MESQPRHLAGRRKMLLHSVQDNTFATAEVSRHCPQIQDELQQAGEERREDSQSSLMKSERFRQWAASLWKPNLVCCMQGSISSKLSDHEEHCAWSWAHVISAAVNCPHPIRSFSEAAWQSQEEQQLPSIVCVLLKTALLCSTIFRSVDRRLSIHQMHQTGLWRRNFPIWWWQNDQADFPIG